MEYGEEYKDMLWELAYNLWWSWTPYAKKLFQQIDPVLWIETEANPIELLRKTKLLDERLREQKFVSQVRYVYTIYKNYLNKPSIYQEIFKKPLIFVSPEYGLHHTLLIYAGGLGFLAGDILKEASDMCFPLMGIGFMYPLGYVKQRIRPDGWQEEIEFTNSKMSMPAKKIQNEDGTWMKCSVKIAGQDIYYGIWKVEVGRTNLYLIDTDVEENSPSSRRISYQLYDKDKDIRLRQKILLGFGAVELLDKLKIEPLGFHINEDYPVFILVAYIVKKIKEGLSFEEALFDVSRKSLFTTHTPLRAGVNIYPVDLVRRYLSFLDKDLGFDFSERIINLARNPQAPDEGFNATVLAIRLSNYINAVSRVHREVSSKIWAFVSREDKYIDYVTNGVHLPTWMCDKLRGLLDRYLGEEWIEVYDRPSVFDLIEYISDKELWDIHMENKRRLIEHIIDRARVKWMNEKVDASSVMAQGVLLDPNFLTIGFARRMTGYKRADLILYDLERLKKILLDPLRPVQIIFAGKSHPEDIEGKRIIQRIFNICKNPDFGGRIAFVEDYDERLAQFLVKGVDVWLNNPIPYLEACGTSGMKASLNGILHLSILDGWWVEGFNGKNGWGFGDDVYDEDRTKKDAEAIYKILEEEVVPLYYQRNEEGIPVNWCKKMREAIRSVAPNFCARRMFKDYISKFYSKFKH